MNPTDLPAAAPQSPGQAFGPNDHLMYSESPTAAKLFVGHLSSTTTEEQLRLLFGHYGDVVEVIIIRDKQGHSKGAAFVTFASTAEADTAIYTLHDRHRIQANVPIQVSYAKSSSNISEFGRHGAMAVHKKNPDANPIPDLC
jgi:RNA recognition motif-containing protein